jgi:hypothetical protein
MKIRTLILIISCLLFLKLSNSQVDTVEIYLEDTSYYQHYTFSESSNEILFPTDTTSIYRFMSSSGIRFFLKDSLDDAFYRIYNLSKNELPLDNKSEYIVLTGVIKNKKREGIFMYKSEDDLKIITFKAGVVHGKVVEYINDRIMYAGEYKNGKKHGYFFFQERVGRPQYIQISYYENGERLHFETFSVEEWYNWD